MGHRSVIGAIGFSVSNFHSRNPSVGGATKLDLCDGGCQVDIKSEGKSCN